MPDLTNGIFTPPPVTTYVEATIPAGMTIRDYQLHRAANRPRKRRFDWRVVRGAKR